MSKPTALLAPAVNFVAILICALVCASTGAAQAQPAQRPGTPPATASPAPSPAASPSIATSATAEHDLSITANVTARELSFEVVPTPKVEFPGQPRRDTVWEAERTNLPAQVQPGVTYRDIGIRLKITSVFADIERIVAEALGEIPASDDAPPKINSNENAQPPVADTRTTSEATQTVEPSTSILLEQTSPASSSARTTRPGVRHGGARTRRERQ
ncbi:MAG TPA: hypothetical protein VEX70_14070 [Pyrinomonadaceae bacterium]|nr:hypothetical protein [Pyrinomonadaceae bacterium]